MTNYKEGRADHDPTEFNYRSDQPGDNADQDCSNPGVLHAVTKLVVEDMGLLPH